jgi:hypothetical protein
VRVARSASVLPKLRRESRRLRLHRSENGSGARCHGAHARQHFSTSSSVRKRPRVSQRIIPGGEWPFVKLRVRWAAHPPVARASSRRLRTLFRAVVSMADPTRARLASGESLTPMQARTERSRCRTSATDPRFENLRRHRSLCRRPQAGVEAGVSLRDEILLVQASEQGQQLWPLVEPRADPIQHRGDMLAHRRPSPGNCIGTRSPSEPERGPSLARRCEP